MANKDFKVLPIKTLPDGSQMVEATIQLVLAKDPAVNALYYTKGNTQIVIHRRVSDTKYRVLFPPVPAGIEKESYAISMNIRRIFEVRLRTKTKTKFGFIFSPPLNFEFGVTYYIHVTGKDEYEIQNIVRQWGTYFYSSFYPIWVGSLVSPR